MTVQVGPRWLSSGGAVLSQPRSVLQQVLSGLEVVGGPWGNTKGPAI